jgi:hypothetical protein
LFDPEDGEHSAVPGETLLDMHEVQSRLKCSKSAAYALTSTVLLHGTVRVGRALRVRESALDTFIMGGGERHIPHPTTNGNGHKAAVATTVRKRSRPR